MCILCDGPSDEQRVCVPCAAWVNAAENDEQRGFRRGVIMGITRVSSSFGDYTRQVAVRVEETFKRQFERD